MNWIIIIISIIVVITTILLLINGLSHLNLVFQVVFTFIYDHEDWKRYRRLKKYLKNNTIPIIKLTEYEGNNAGFAFIQYDDIIFIIHGDNLYLGSYYNHLINDLLKRNNHAS